MYVILVFLFLASLEVSLEQSDKQLREVYVIFSLTLRRSSENIQGWGVAVLVGVPHKDDSFMTKPINVLNERTLKGTFFGNYKPRTDLPKVVDLYMKKVGVFKVIVVSHLAIFVLNQLRRVPDLVSFASAATGSGEVHHSQSAVLRDQQGIRLHGQGPKHSLHHQLGRIDVPNIRRKKLS